MLSNGLKKTLGSLVLLGIVMTGLLAKAYAFLPGNNLDPESEVLSQSKSNKIFVNVDRRLEAAMKKYDNNNLIGAQKVLWKVGEMLYAQELHPKSIKKYAECTSKFALLTLKLNRVLHETKVTWEPEDFTMPIPHNYRIEKQIDYYMTRGRKSFSLWLRRSGKYVPQLKEYFAQEGLPQDLVYLALIESGFNPRTKSVKQALGLFQFIKGTADLVGLKQNYWLDERRAPEKAALGAVKHLKYLYEKFGDWDLAMAAYNAGAGRVGRAIKAQGTKDFWELALPPETEAYVPKFYAALIISKEPELYGFSLEFDSPELSEQVLIPGGVDFKVIADCIGTSATVIADLNTELTKNCTPPKTEPYPLRLPLGTGEKFQQAFDALPEDKKFLTQEELGKRKFKGVYIVYKVKSGDSLYTIAKRHHTTVSKIKRYNASVRNKKYILPGQRLRIYRTR